MPGRHPGWGSAYPRQTTYTRPAHPNGLGINQAVNAPVIGVASRPQVSMLRSTLGIMDARAAAAGQIFHSATPLAQQALSRRGAVDALTARANEVHGLRQNRQDKPQSNFSNVNDRPEALPPKGVVGSSPQVHSPVAAVNHKSAEASMDKVVDTVLQSPTIGVGKPTLVIPKWENRRK